MQRNISCNRLSLQEREDPDTDMRVTIPYFQIVRSVARFALPFLILCLRTP